jgi:hypothetical protein
MAWSPPVGSERPTLKSLWMALVSVFSVDLAFVTGAAWGRGQAVALLSVFTVITGYADSRGFVHAAKVWAGGTVVWREVALSGVAFLIGVVAYWIVLRFAGQLGVRSAMLQTIGWFAVTILAVALTDAGQHSWSLFDAATAAVVISGLGLLMYRTAA